ncbi:hypothetical protein V2J09_016555 [Rumex salicifolius]
MLNGSNFKVWKENVEIVLGCMDLDLALRTERPILVEDNSNEAKVERWDRSNRMSLMIMKRSIPEAFRGSISESTNAKESLEAIQQYFAKNEKAETSNHLAALISMRYKGKGNIREYIMEMSNLAGKLKALKLEITDDFLVHLVLLSLPTQFTQFKVSYNTQKEKWTLNELISQCVQEEDKIQRDKTESAHFASSSQNNRKNKAKDAAGTHMQKKVKKGDELTCFFCKKAGHMKKDCPKYAVWRVKKERSRGFKFYNPTTRSFFETGNARFLEDVEFGGEGLRRVTLDEVVPEEEKFICLPNIVIESDQGNIPDTLQETNPASDNNEVPSIVQTQQPQEVPLRRSVRERRYAIPDDYISKTIL